MNEQTARFQVPPVEKSILVPCAPARAFAAFTEEIGKWWPLATYSIAQAKAQTCAIEPWVGGRVYERDSDGQEHIWGQVTRWSPPLGFAMSFSPGRPPETAQIVSVSFTPEGEATRVTLVHAGWEKLGERALTVRGNYDRGWETVLGHHFRNAVSPAT